MHRQLERVTGFEPVSEPWQGPILAARRYPHGASASALLCAPTRSYRSLSSPACKTGTQPISHTRLRYTYLHSIVKEHTSAATRGRLDPSRPDALLPDLSAVKTHWSGTPDSNRESHDSKSCGLNRFPSARRKVLAKSERAGLSTGPVMRILSTISYGAMDLHAH